MSRPLLAFVLILVGFESAFAQTNFYTLFTNGPTTNRLNIVVLSEGYTINQVTNAFRMDATNALSKLLSQPPYREYSNYFNGFAIAVPSRQSGSSHPVAASFKDTFFKSSYGASDFVITIPPNELDSNYGDGQGKVDSLLQTFMPNYGFAALLVNDVVSGGSCGISNKTAISFTYSGNTFLVHESAHALASLGDEYFTPLIFPDVEEPNTTRQTNSDSIKWKSWITNTTPIPTPATLQYDDAVGLFEGAHYHAKGWYRPREDCIMRSFGGPPFCEVCSETLVKAIYQKVRPVDAFAPADTSISVSGTQPMTFNLTLLQPATHNLDVQWFADGTAVSGETNLTFSITPQALGDGRHRVSALVVDNTPLVRNDPTKLLTQTITWGQPLISVTGGTGGTVSGGGSVAMGDSTIVTASPNSGYTFANWTENGTVVSTSATYKFTVTGNRDLIAYFNLSGTSATSKLSLTVSPGGSGKTSGAGTFRTETSRTVKATANNGFLFANWTENGAVTSSNASYTFKLSSDRTLTANFVTNLFQRTKGTYSGLFFETPSTSLTSSGFLSINTTAKGAFSGTLLMPGARYPVSGQFGPTGRATKTIKRGILSPLELALSMDLTNGTGRMDGSLTNNGLWGSIVVAFRTVFDAKTNKAPQAGQYTLIVPAMNSTVLPGGDSFGTLTVGISGRLRFSGSLADGTKVSQATSISMYGDWPLYIPLYGGRGSLLGWFAFDSPTNQVSGLLHWLKLGTKSKHYSNEFGFSTFSTGSRYLPPKGSNVLGFAEGRVLLEGRELSPGITNSILISDHNSVTNQSSNKLSLVLTPSTGLFRGTVVQLGAAKSTPISFSGVVLQHTNVGRGFFLRANQSGTVLIRQ
jgi:hypothetical protein